MPPCGTQRRRRPENADRHRRRRLYRLGAGGRAQRTGPRRPRASSTISAATRNGATSPSVISTRSCRSSGLLPLARPPRRRRRGGVSPRRQLLDVWRPMPTDHRHQPQLLRSRCGAGARPRAGQLIYASSAATYGDGSAGFDDAGGIDGLEAPAAAQPLWLVEARLRSVGDARGGRRGRAPPQWAGLKFFNVFGPNEYHKGDMMSLVVKNCRGIADGETIRLFKSHRPDYRRRRAAPRFRLRQGLRRGDAVALAPAPGERQRHLQSRHRHRRAASST